MPPLKPYASASPQAQSLNAPRHMPLETAAEREYYGGRPRSFPAGHQPPATNSPQNTHHYPPPNQPPQMQYQQPQPSYQYGAQVQPPNVASPPPQYGGHPAPRGHESQSIEIWVEIWVGPEHIKDTRCNSNSYNSNNSHHRSRSQLGYHTLPNHQSPRNLRQPSRHGLHNMPLRQNPPPPSSSVPPQPSWASAPPPPRGHDPMALRDVRDVYPPHRMQPLQQYAPASRAPEPPPPQAPAAYPRYANTPVPGRDPRDPGPPRSYTPVNAYDSRGYPPPSAQDIREAHLREQQQQVNAAAVIKASG
ncbi:hypothetical protein GL218_00816 [Daldinia childiae]|uniref:uncharacterized protein n=2 Tax=Daldinia childiae TaxID=326645 RepID=UPI001444DEB3|nr:uncharacterized protein GL218_00816 [Daldinia childiae]KAF3070417.1 hypothetical protein GL218_00816 [Daldinia childiae]